MVLNTINSLSVNHLRNYAKRNIENAIENRTQVNVAFEEKHKKYVKVNFRIEILKSNQKLCLFHLGLNYRLCI